MSLQRKNIFISAYFFAIVSIVLGFAVPMDAHADTVNNAATTTPSSNLTNGLLGYWPLHAETTYWTSAFGGTTADASGNGHTGTLTALGKATSTAIGKIGQAIKFDGVTPGARIAIAGTSTFGSLSALTASAWINVSAGGSGGGAIVTTEGNSINGWKFYTNSTQSIGFEVKYSTTPLSVTSNNATMFFNKWNFVVVTWDGSTNATNAHIYINGVEPSYASQVNGVGSRSSDTAVTIGNVSTGSTRELTGKIDDVRVYNRVLSQNELQALYHLGVSTVNKNATTTGLGNSDLNSGLSAYWPFDAKYIVYGSSGNLGTSTDASGNGNSAAIKNENRLQSVTLGKLGQALKFNGSAYTQGPSGIIGSGATSVCAWINQAVSVGSVNAIVANTKFIFYTSNSNNTIGLTSDGSTNAVAANNTVINGVWEYVCGTRDASGTTNLYVNGTLSGSANQSSGSPSTSTFNTNVAAKGNGIANFYNGSIDDVRIYNRVLTATEISQLYSQGVATVNKAPSGTNLKNGLLLNWSFDGKYTSWNPASTTLGTTTDLSGNGRDGTIKNIRRSAMVPGRIGQAISVASTTSNSQAVTLNVPLITSTTTAISYGGWFYIKNPGQTSIPSSVGVVGQNIFSLPNSGFFLYQSSANRYQCNVNANAGPLTPASGVVANHWYHLFCVSTGTVMSVYLNSILVATSSATGSVFPNNQAFSLSAIPGDGAINGYADDIRVYNRALSAAEVKAIYNLGK